MNSLTKNYNDYLQMLFEGLQGSDFKEYVDLLINIENPWFVEMSDGINYLMFPNNDSTFQMMMNNYGWSLTDLLSMVKNSDFNYNANDDFVALIDFEFRSFSYEWLKERYLREVGYLLNGGDELLQAMILNYLTTPELAD
jgi:hypothetical protein